MTPLQQRSPRGEAETEREARSPGEGRPPRFEACGMRSFTRRRGSFRRLRNTVRTPCMVSKKRSTSSKPSSKQRSALASSAASASLGRREIVAPLGLEPAGELDPRRPHGRLPEQSPGPRPAREAASTRMGSPMSNVSNVPNVFVGVDVSKASLDACILRDDGSVVTSFSVPNSAPGCRDLCARLSPFSVLRFTLEPSGGYESTLLAHLKSTALPVHFANAFRIRSFAFAAAKTAKTDKLDARLIADFGRTFQHEPLRPLHRKGARTRQPRRTPPAACADALRREKPPRTRQ